MKIKNLAGSVLLAGGLAACAQPLAANRQAGGGAVFTDTDNPFSSSASADNPFASASPDLMQVKVKDDNACQRAVERDLVKDLKLATELVKKLRTVGKKDEFE